jgi:hypothetical protein
VRADWDSQIPTSKSQTNFKFQIPMTKTESVERFEILVLILVWSLFFGICGFAPALPR